MSTSRWFALAARVAGCVPSGAFGVLQGLGPQRLGGHMAPLGL
ncbi:MAG TPA: hypothetical protein PKG77_24205 [Phycisphaerae bacterium]|nr:hypothetical protein [Phycisphaerae bacterium]HQL71567.1 hypothetical protein [Phycisphaerae bacterium]